MNKITKKQKLDNLLNEFPLKKSLMTKEEAERNITVINNKDKFKLINKRKQNDRVKNKQSVKFEKEVLKPHNKIKK